MQSLAALSNVVGKDGQMRKSRYIGKRYVDAVLSLCTSLTLAMRPTGFLFRIPALVSAISYSRKECPATLELFDGRSFAAGSGFGVFRLTPGYETRDRVAAR